ncbi:MAG: LuxR C-terminal-related transcriptional regulator [Trueperaceae bacterium]
MLERRTTALDGQPVELAAILTWLVQANLAHGELGPAQDATQRLEEFARRYGQVLIEARAASSRARLSTARGELTVASRQFERALTLYAGLPLPVEAARTRLAYAYHLSATQPEPAVAEAQAALAAFEQLGAGDIDVAAALLRSTGAVARIGPKKAGVLTRREMEVFRLIGFGLSNPEIAQRLSISRKTAAHHVSSILAKIGLRNRAQAAAQAVRSEGKPADSRDFETSA